MLVVWVSACKASLLASSKFLFSRYLFIPFTRVETTCSSAQTNTACLAFVADSSVSKFRVSLCLLNSSFSFAKLSSFFSKACLYFKAAALATRLAFLASAITRTDAVLMCVTLLDAWVTTEMVSWGQTSSSLSGGDKIGQDWIYLFMLVFSMFILFGSYHYYMSLIHSFDKKVR